MHYYNDIQKKNDEKTTKLSTQAIENNNNPLMVWSSYENKQNKKKIGKERLNVIRHNKYNIIA